MKELYSFNINQKTIVKNSNFNESIPYKLFYLFMNIKLLIDNYKSIEALAKTPKVNENDLNNLINIIVEYDSKLIPKHPDNNKMINNSFAKEAINDQN